MRVYEVNENMGMRDVAFIRINDVEYGLTYAIAVKHPNIVDGVNRVTILINLEEWAGTRISELEGLGFRYMRTNSITNCPLSEYMPSRNRGVEILGEDVDITTCYSAETIQALILRGYLGRQVTNTSHILGLYDWAILENDTNQVGILFKYMNERVGFYHQDLNNLIGSTQPRERITNCFPMLQRWSRHSWFFGEIDLIHYAIEDLNEYSYDGPLHLIEEQVDLHAILRDNMLIANSDTTSAESTETVAQMVEVTNFISNKYTQDVEFIGQQSYHAHRGCIVNVPKKSYKHRIGIELEVEFNSQSLKDKFNNLPSNWFYRENDGSLGNYGCEIITIPLLPSDAKSVDFWQPLCSYLQNKAKSWDTGRCGLHVHIGREILGKNEEQQSETIGKLLYMYHHWLKDTRLNIRVYGREEAYHDHDGKTDVGNAAKTLGSSVLKEKSVKDKVKTSMINKSNEGRYFDINLQNDATIEFRKGKGSIKPERISMVVEYSELLCIYAKNTPWQQISYDDLVNFLKVSTHNEDLKQTINSWR